MRVTRVEIAALLAVAQDHAFGQPPGSQLRATAIAQRLAEAVGAPRATTWWASTLRFLGCTGHAFETAVLLGDEIDLRAESLRVDTGDPAAVVAMMVRRAGPGRVGVRRLPAVAGVLAGGKAAMELNFRAACEVADAFAARLGLDDAARAALAATFERWNGRGLPAGLRGDAIPRPMRVAQLAQELEVLARADGVDAACAVLRRRRGRSCDPELVDAVLDAAAGWFADASAEDPWDAALASAPVEAPLDPDRTRDALLLLADFADLKSPWTAGHSRGVAALAAVAGPVAEAAALVHDLGRVTVPNTIWDKPGPLTRDERDRAETHSLVTEQLLRRVPGLAAISTVAGAAHERVDGSGYHRRVGGAQLDEAARVLAAADCYQAMTSPRPHRAAFPPTAAAATLRETAGLDREAVERVLVAAGHRRVARPRHPAGLTGREVEVLRLLTLGLTTRQMADRLVISPKTADHHVQHIYGKIGVSTRGAAALYAMETGLLAP